MMSYIHTYIHVSDGRITFIIPSPQHYPIRGCFQCMGLRVHIKPQQSLLFTVSENSNPIRCFLIFKSYSKITSSELLWSFIWSTWNCVNDFVPCYLKLLLVYGFAYISLHGKLQIKCKEETTWVTTWVSISFKGDTSLPTVGSQGRDQLTFP